jgi:pyruvate dehydrogenase E1 component alpha subunit
MTELPLPERAHAHHLLRQMLRIRRLEEKSAEMYTLGKIRGFLHLYIGQEAVAVGMHEAVRDGDNSSATYREHGHALMAGIPAGAIMAEMYGKREGCSRGRGGSMHLFSTEHRFFGGNAIVAGGLPLAVGLALADRMRGRNAVTLCWFGDGAVAEGEFHESLNLAALWNLPVAFLCENNLYAMGTALGRAQAEVDIAKKATGYAMKSEVVDGMDVLAVEAAGKRILHDIREGGGPWLVELRTYRFCAHSMFDAQMYRDKSEVRQWQERDPIDTFETRLRRHDLITPDERAALERTVAAEVEDAVAFAEAGTWEPVDRLLDDVYTQETR